MTGGEYAVVILAGSNMDLRPGSDGPGLMAFMIVAALVVVCVFLYRSMRKHLRNIDIGSSSPPGQPRPPGAPGRPDRGAADGGAGDTSSS